LIGQETHDEETLKEQGTNDMRAQTKREQFKTWQDHRSLLVRAHVARSHPDRLMRQISEHPIERDTHWNICHEFRNLIFLVPY
jgi:hypothetical protein